MQRFHLQELRGEQSMIQENPQYFKNPSSPTGGQWDNWEDALIWIGVLVVVILGLILYKYLRKRF